ncbi:MAG: nucleotidyltransferase domain-containing protein [Verrucomicrobia bacterium]|nr:nucleotidyltransferase domain-containing protein [Verrucomicrobiota bacterium]
MTIDPRLHRVVAAQPYPLLFATISGAHLYGFPSPDSDFDLRGAHVLPLEKVVGLDVREETIEGKQTRLPPHPGPLPIGGGEGGAVEMDFVSHDVRKFFGLLLKKNGYVLEQLFSPLIVHTTPEHAELKVICRARLNPRSSRGNEARSWPGKGQSLLTSAATGVITKHHAHHYFGFAETQWKLFDKERPRRVKPLLYVYRVLLTGIHLMRTGEVEANLVTLNEKFRLPYISELIERKIKGENTTLLEADFALHESEYRRLRGELQTAHDASQLPELPSEETRAALNDLLVRIRLQGLGVRF